MLEPLFGSAAPMWTLPPSGLGVQSPIGVGNAQIGSSLFGASNLTALGGVPAAPQPLSGPATVPTSLYGYNPGLIAWTAPSLLAAVAMRRGQPQGPATDAEIEDFIYDALELLPGASDIEVRCDGGRVMLTGSVPHKRVKHDAGEIAWAIPIIHDLQNNLAIASRRRSRGTAREGEGTAAVPTRKQN